MGRPHRITRADVKGSKHAFSFEGRPTGTLQERAEDYFAKQYWSHLGGKTTYRFRHRNILTPLEYEEVAEFAAMYEKMVPLVCEAHEFLTSFAKPLVDLWLISEGSLQIAYTEVLTDVLENSPDFIDAHFEGNRDAYHGLCHNTVQWLGGWLRDIAA